MNMGGASAISTGGTGRAGALGGAGFIIVEYWV
jgi:hypothetical protein